MSKFEIEYPGLSISYFRSPKDKDQAIRRIIGMQHPSFAYENGVPIYEKIIKKYKDMFDIDDADISKKYREILEHQSKETSGGKMRKSKKSRKSRKSTKSRKSRKSRKPKKSRKSRKSQK